MEEDVSSSQHHLPINVNQLFFIIADFKYNSLEGYVAKEEMPEYLSNLFRAKRPLQPIPAMHRAKYTGLNAL